MGYNVIVPNDAENIAERRTKGNGTMTENVTAPGQEENERKRQRSALLGSAAALLLKLVVFAVLLIIFFGYVFGVTMNTSVGMQPSFRRGDMLLYFRMANRFAADDVVLIRYEGDLLPERVIALPGDIVDVTEDGLLVNGACVKEPKAVGETLRVGGAVEYPLTVPEGKLFVLGDNREYAADSRAFGCVDAETICGQVVGLFRRHGL